MKQSDGLVYSTSHGRICPRCNRPEKQCRCGKEDEARPAGDGIVRVSRQTKGRKGKGVTIITGVPLDKAGIKTLARELKAQCGSGGTVKAGVIEIQGDHRDKLLETLRQKGWSVKKAGG